jgi:16S rRNA (cytosine1402-N4)-methyltransferase
MIMTSTEHPFEEKSSQAHLSVMPKEVLEYLNVQDKGIYVDCTLGLAGHTKRILEKGGSQSKVVGLDRDKDSLQKAKELLGELSTQCIFVQDDFRNIDRVLEKLEIDEVDGILMDLGISSFQLDNPQRGFSFRNDGPLDMRLDQDSFISAYDLINTLSEKELAAILRDFGDERWHNRIAHFVVENRKKHPIQTTKELSEIILRAIPPYASREKIHPATRSFQAIRIAVNRELESVDQALTKAIHFLKPKARLVAISFHSLEDRIVKNKFKQFVKDGLGLLLTKKPLGPSAQEEIENPRARSARLRVIERI